MTNRGKCKTMPQFHKTVVVICGVVLFGVDKIPLFVLLDTMQFLLTKGFLESVTR